MLAGIITAIQQRIWRDFGGISALTFHAVCALEQDVILRFGSGLFFTAASGKKPCLAHCRSFRRSLPKRKIFAVWTDLETWPWLSRCASLAMPANDEGKLIAYKWRKSAILETPEEIFCRGETHAAHLARHPSPLHGKNRAK